MLGDVFFEYEFFLYFVGFLIYFKFNIFIKSDVITTIYKYDNVENYYGNLAYLDEKIGEIISILKQAKKFDLWLIFDP